jgi:hypothetical protein
MIAQNDNLGGIVFTVTRVILILSLAIIAIPTVAPAQSTASSASQPPGPEPLPPMPADANPSFEVATIKPSETSAPHGTFFRMITRVGEQRHRAVRRRALSCGETGLEV